MLKSNSSREGKMVATAQAQPKKVREENPSKKMVTCRTCGLKKCVGRCLWDATPRPETPPKKSRA
jgi:hypothetical protein